MSDTALDIAHLGFLELTRALIGQSGAANAKGTLIRLAIKMGERLPESDYATFEEFVEASAAGTSPVSYIEGSEVHIGDGVFGLSVCPFAASIADYSAVFGELHESFNQLTAEFNKPAAITEEYRVGNGGAVSPFCALHQPMRSSAEKRVTIGGKRVNIYQLGAKSWEGNKALAKRWIQEAGRTEAEIEKVLDHHMCCYAIRVEK